MGWRIVAVSEVPLGRRILRIGIKGNDVYELQQLLAVSGFYFGTVDGVYGILTEEAVSLFQRTFNLRIDGIAGPELLRTLKTTSLKQNRIIYTVKPKEDLKTISRNFGVSKSAWQSIPGQGNPQRKIYPGMKLILNQKAVMCWGRRTANFPATACLEAVWEIGDEDQLVEINHIQDRETYGIVIAQPETWKRILASHNHWAKFGAELKREGGNHWGIDLRNAPLETIFRWSDLLHYLCKVISIRQIPMILIPMPANEKTIKNRLFWGTLPQISNLAQIIIVEPQAVLDSPSTFLKSSIHLERTLQKLMHHSLSSKTLLMGSAGGWEWNIDQDRPCRPVSFREGRILAAMNHRSVKYDPDTTYTTVDYMRRHERHCIIFRDQQGWLDWAKIGIKANLFGFVIHNPKDLGRFGIELINGSFGVLAEDQL